MKQFAKFLSLAALAAAFVSCVKENEKPAVDAAEGIQLTINAGAPETKTYVEGVSPFWKSTDVLGVFTGSDNTNAQFPNTQADGKKGVFTGTVPSAGKYYAYYPYSNIYGANTTGVSCQFPAEQHPTPTSFDGAADFLVSEAFDVTSTDAQTLDKLIFKRVGAFLKFSFKDATTGSILSGEYVKEVKVIVNLNVESDYRPCPAFRMTPDGIGTVGDGMKTITAKYDDNVYELTAAGNATWFGIRPNTFAAGNTFDLTVTTSKYSITKTITLPSAVTVAGGDIQPINVTVKDENVKERVFQTKVEKLWELLSPSSSKSWTQEYLNASEESDRNIAIDGTNVYMAEFAEGKKNIYAINIESTTNSSADYSLLPVGTVTDDQIRAVTCPRIVKNAAGEPVLMVSQLSKAAGTMNLYVYDKEGGINSDPRVVTLSRQYSSQRLGDTFTVWGTYEKCMLFFHGMDGNGFVTFPFASGLSASSARLTGRLNTSELLVTTKGGFAAYHPYPDNIKAGIADNRSFGRYYEIATEADLWTAEGPITVSSTQMDGIWETPNTNAGTEGHNFIEFNGKRYVIYGCRLEGFNTGYLVIKEGALTDSWLSIINRGMSKTIFLSKLYGNGHASGNGSGLDVAVWQEENQVLIAIDMQDVGLQVYRMYKE